MKTGAKPKKQTRYVRIDMGYHMQGFYETAKVIKEETRQGLFGGETTSLLVERGGGERIWVDFWEEIVK
jgi:hypothetical protein